MRDKRIGKIIGILILLVVSMYLLVFCGNVGVWGKKAFPVNNKVTADDEVFIDLKKTGIMSSDDISKGKYGYLNTGELVLGTGEFGMSPLSGKIAAFTGDSICDGPGYPGGYAKIIGDENNMTVQNIAEGGGAIVPTSEYFCISTSIADLRADADYIILEGGVNDSGRLYPLGTITEGYSDKLDTTTFAGAFENMLKSAISRFPGKKIGFIITHKCHDRFDSTTTGSYYSVAVEACKKWGVPYLDLNSLVPPLAYIDELRMAYTDNGDGYHPNEQGYRQFYVDKIVAWMKTL